MRIYIASPYGDHNPLSVREANVAMADEAARLLALRGHDAVTPLRLTHGWGEDTRLSPNDWWALDESLLWHWAQAVCRLPGESPGADRECQMARERGIPIYYGVEAVP